MASDLNTKVSRRNILKVGAGVGLGAAVIGVPGLVFLKDDGSSAAPNASANLSGGSLQDGIDSGPLVAYVRDAKSGEVVIMQGVNERVIKDPKLVAQLLGVVEG